jgi:RNA polymerase sigma factor (sigma-70 family)
MRRFAHARGLRGADVDDCLQTVWMEVAAGLTRFERSAERSGLRAWLYTLVRSKACDLLSRRAKRSADSLDAARLAGREPLAADGSPVDVLESEWERALLETVLNDLRDEISETNWRLLRMRFVEGCAPAEVASALGLSPEEVRYRQSRLLKKLRGRVAALTGNAVAA